MKQTIAQNCPLCESDAVFYFVDFDERKYFKCPKCTKFMITRRAESRLAEAPDGWREKLSKLPKQAAEGYVLDIYVASPVSSEEAPYLASKYISKADLRL